ncbi:MAG: hypothetical protein ACYC1F_09750 [Gallionellaceae bacterium]
MAAAPINLARAWQQPIGQWYNRATLQPPAASDVIHPLLDCLRLAGNRHIHFQTRRFRRFCAGGAIVLPEQTQWTSKRFPKPKPMY